MNSSSTDLTQAQSSRLPNSVSEAARRILEEGTAPNTLRAYRIDLAYWGEWGRLRHLVVLPCSVETAMTFLIDHIDGLPSEVDAGLLDAKVKAHPGLLAISTVRRRIAALSAAHKSRALDNPFEDSRFRLLLSKAGRAAARRGYAPKRKTALALELFEQLLTCCDDGLRGKRDRALILFAFSSGGRRRSEVASATFDRLDPYGDEFVYRLGVTKTTQDGDAGTVPVTGRAAEALAEWIKSSGLSRGPIFRAVLSNGNISTSALAPRQVNRIVKRLAAAAGLDARNFGAHSLRSGFMTETGLQGISLVEAMELSQHKDVRTAARYHQAGRGLRNKAARIIG